jgi:hypothetical protein
VVDEEVQAIKLSCPNLKKEKGVLIEHQTEVHAEFWENDSYYGES